MPCRFAPKYITFTKLIWIQTSPSQEPVKNLWDQVDDFKWLKSEPSPNWSTLPVNQRLQEDIWTTVVPGGPGVGLDDILKKVGISKEK
jgi:tubulin-specific chaperone C